MKIVYLDCHTVNPGDLDWGELTELGELQCYDRTAPDEIIPRIGDAEVVITNKVPLTEATFTACPRLRLVCVSATGYDVVDIQAARAHGIPVCNCAGYSTQAVAQTVVAHLLEVCNQVGHYSRTICEEGEWTGSRDFCYWNRPIIELSGLRVAIVGLGNIGQAVADRLRPFGVRLCAVTSKSADQLPADIRKVTLDEAFTQCDVVSLNCPLTPENRAMVDARRLASVNPGLILINTARGGLIDEQAVADALTAGRLRAYCCDVLSHEPALADNPLLTAPRVYITPHIAWAAPGARRRIIDILIRNIKAYLDGHPTGVVNGL